MRKRILGAAAILLFWLVSCDNGSLGNSDVDQGDEENTLVCLGDSLTAGYGAGVPGEDDKTKSYPAHLRKKVNIPVVNAGVSGDTTALGLARLREDVLSKNPRIVIIELGANDLFQGVSLTTTANNLRSIINLVSGEKRKIYVAKFYTEKVAREMLRWANITDSNVQNLLIAQYDTMFGSLAVGGGVEIIEDIWSGVWGIHMSDIVHPNGKGYEIMAENYFTALEPYLRAEGLLK